MAAVIKAAAEWAAAGKAATVRAGAEKDGKKKAATERAAAEKAVTKKAAAEKAATERATDGNAALEMAAKEKAAARLQVWLSKRRLTQRKKVHWTGYDDKIGSNDSRGTFDEPSMNELENHDDPIDDAEHHKEHKDEAL